MERLLIMVNSLYGGGAERILQTIVSHIDYEKYDVTLYSLHEEELDRQLYKGPFHYRYVFRRGNGFFRKLKGWIFNHCSAKIFYRLYIRGRFDTEVAFIEGESTKIISGSTNARSRKLAWVHIDLKNNPWTDFLFRDSTEEAAHYDRFDQILCVSDDVRQAFLEKYGIDSEKVRTQYNPVDRDSILSKAQEPCGLPPKKRLRMVAVGRLVEQKGFDRLLRIVKRLNQDGYEFELFILGEGQERTALARFIDENRLSQQVSLLGFQENPYCFMAASDLLVCSSRAEGFSTVVTEAVVLGMPVVSTDCAGVRELFGDAECGVITENNEDALYEALKKVLSDSGCLDRYRQAALKRGGCFSLEESMKQLDQLFSKDANL